MFPAPPWMMRRGWWVGEEGDMVGDGERDGGKGGGLGEMVRERGGWRDWEILSARYMGFGLTTIANVAVG